MNSRGDSYSLTDDADFEYDPLADSGIQDDDDVDGSEDYDASEGQLGPTADARTTTPVVPEKDDREPQERIEDLFAAWKTRRRILLGILSFVDTPQSPDALQEKVDDLQRYDRSVYTGYDYASVLEEAGAITKINEDGSPFDEEAEQEPEIVEVDGARFYKPTDGKQFLWVATEDGRAYAQKDDPFTRLANLIEQEETYRGIYKDVLEFCSQDGGRSSQELDELVSSNPLTKSPYRHYSYFARKLEECEGLAWTTNWSTTEVGVRGLSELSFEVAGESTAETDDQKKGA